MLISHKNVHQRQFFLLWPSFIGVTCDRKQPVSAYDTTSPGPSPGPVRKQIYITYCVRIDFFENK